MGAIYYFFLRIYIFGGETAKKYGELTIFYNIEGLDGRDKK